MVWWSIDGGIEADKAVENTSKVASYAIIATEFNIAAIGCILALCFYKDPKITEPLRDDVAAPTLLMFLLAALQGFAPSVLHSLPANAFEALLGLVTVGAALGVIRTLLRAAQTAVRGVSNGNTQED